MDILIMSASRKECLKRLMESLSKIKYSGKFRYLIHEDFVFRNKSKEVIRYIESLGLFEVIEKHDPWIGQGPALVKMISMIESKYFWHFEDDWELEREIPLDDIVSIMDESPDINQIWLNYRRNRAKVEGRSGFHRIRREIGKYVILLEDDWRMMPGVWRKEFLDDKYKWFGEREDYPIGNFQTKLKKDLRRLEESSEYRHKFMDEYVKFDNQEWWAFVKDQNVPFIKEKIGSYVWGDIDDCRYVNHTGGNLSMQRWHRKKVGGRPKGGGQFNAAMHAQRGPGVALPEPDPSSDDYVLSELTR